MKKIIFAVTVLALMASVTMGADMIAGNPKNGANVVGTVDVSVDGTDLVVVYTITDLGTLGSTQTRPVAMNNSAQITGITYGVMRR